MLSQTPSSVPGRRAGYERQARMDGFRAVPPESWNASPVLEGAAALFASDEDVAAEHAQGALDLWCDAVETVAFTRGYHGADVCHRGEWRHIDAFPANAVDPTGAGDVFRRRIPDPVARNKRPLGIHPIRELRGFICGRGRGRRSGTRSPAGGDTASATSGYHRGTLVEPAQIIGTLRARADEVRAICVGLDDEQMRRRPKENEWALLEICCHLRDTRRRKAGGFAG